jgi:hypothetical protein
MRVAVQEHVDLLRCSVGWDMDEPEAHAVPLQVNDQGPFDIAVAIAAHNCHRGADSLYRQQKTRSAHVPKVPDFIGSFRERFDVSGEMIVGVGQDEDAERQRHGPSLHISERPYQFLCATL